MDERIDHTGIIESIENNLISIRIIQQSACAGCHAKSMCTASDSKEKIIEVIDNSGRFHVNEQVMICGESSLGLLAVLYAFVIPLLLIVLALAIGTSMQLSETASALLGMLTVIPYYGLLYLFRNKLKKKFVFTLKKLN